MASSRVSVNCLRKNSSILSENVNKGTFAKRKHETSPGKVIGRKPAFNDVENDKSKFLENKRIKTEKAENFFDMNAPLTRAKVTKLQSTRLPLSSIPPNAVSRVKLESKKSTNTTLLKVNNIKQKAQISKPVTRSSAKFNPSTATAKVSSFRKVTVPPSKEHQKQVVKVTKVVDKNVKSKATEEQLVPPVAEPIAHAETVTVTESKIKTEEYSGDKLVTLTEENVTEVRRTRSVKFDPAEDSETKSNRPVKSEPIDTSSENSKQGENDTKLRRRSSTRYSTRKSLSVSSAEKSDENGSLYISALEDITNVSIDRKSTVKTNLPYPISEFDKELLHDPQQVSLYAMEIFDYLKSREANFQISDYMTRQVDLSKKMRAVLVDWMVEVQENFELNHETLYLSVKVVDKYLSKVHISKDSLQLVGAAALFLSCKYDERLSPLLDDFVYICDGAYTSDHLLAMEQSVLKHLEFELSFPISYSFLRRYARCARIQMPLLTLARYILELALMEYRTITLSDSKQAAAALYLGFRMVKHSEWTDTMEYYTGYKLSDFKDIVLLFNEILHQKPTEDLKTIRTKYSHKLFFEVAKTPLISDRELNLDK